MKVHPVRFPSLELSFLPNSLLKGIPTPLILHVDRDNVGGCYWDPEDTEYLLYGERYIDSSRGVIQIAEQSCLEEEADVIAHEWRHHWQYVNGLMVNDEPSGPKWNHLSSTLPYEDAIRAYFRTQWFEMNALLFARRFSKHWLTEWWLELLRKP